MCCICKTNIRGDNRFNNLSSEEGSLQYSMSNGRAYSYVGCKADSALCSLFKGIAAIAIGSGSSYGLAKLMQDSNKGYDVMVPGILGECITLSMAIIGIVVVVRACCKKTKLIPLEETVIL